MITKVLDEKYTNKDILKAVSKLSEYERDNLLAFLNIVDLRNLLNGNKDFDEYYSNIMLLAHHYKVLADTLKDLYSNIDDLLLDGKRAFLEDYIDLTDNEKTEIALEMLNNADFQKNCCEIFVKDYKRIINTNDFLKSLDNILGIGKWYEKCIQNGTGYNHKYEVE